MISTWTWIYRINRQMCTHLNSGIFLVSKYHIGYILFFLNWSIVLRLSRWFSGKESACQCRRHKRIGFSLWVGKIPWSRKGQPTPVFLPGKSHEQRNLAGSSPGGPNELDTTTWLSIIYFSGTWLPNCKAQLLSNVVLVSAIQWSDSATGIHISLPVGSPSHPHAPILLL